MRPEPVPAHIYFDTSVIAAAMIAGVPHYGPSAVFCARLVAADSRIYFSQLLRVEFVNMLRNLATRDRKRLPAALRAQYKLDDWHSSYRVRKEWLDFGIGELQAFLSHFAEVIELPLRAEVCEDGIELMSRHDLNSNDAIHLATARAHQIEHLATVDRDYERITAPPRVWLVRDP